MATLDDAKGQLDLVMRKARVHWYKPIQIAEILYHHRLNPDFDLRELERYRARSRRWRDEVSRKLVGRVSTSSARFQDNLFEKNAMPPEYIAALGEANEKGTTPGVVEAYIYGSLAIQLGLLAQLVYYLTKATPETFMLRSFVELFKMSPGLRRSIDKAYEIIVYALFDTLVYHMEATVTLRVAKSKLSLLREFEDFAAKVLGLTPQKPEIAKAARLCRVGVTHAADRGLDMWANFGPAVQVKHVSLNQELAGDIVSEVAEDAMVVIVCDTAEQQVVESVLTQTGFSHRIQGIVTFADLDQWYSKCFEPRFAGTLGETLLESLRNEFALEFPSTGTTLIDFQKERGYDKIKLGGLWRPPSVAPVLDMLGETE